MRKRAFIIIQVRVLIVDVDNEKKKCTQFYGYYGIGRVRMRQSQGSGSFDRVVCGVQSYDPAWQLWSYDRSDRIVCGGLNSFTTEFQFPNFPYLDGIKCRKLGENRGYIGKAL